MCTLLAELVDGPAAGAAWILNPQDPGLLRSLATLTADAATGSTIASHVDHLRYGLHLLNRWSDGDDPFATTHYAASWRRAIENEPCEPRSASMQLMSRRRPFR